MAFRKATTTKHRHRPSTCSDITQSDTQMPVVLDMSLWKRAPADMLAPNNNRGMTYQTDEKHLTIFPEYFVGVVKQLTSYWRSWAPSFWEASLGIGIFNDFCPLLAFDS
jgi:hypothetical protein